MSSPYNTSIVPTPTALEGGNVGVTGSGAVYDFTVGGTWLTGDEITLIFTDQLTGLPTQVGAGTVSGLLPIFCFTFSNKEYVLAGSTAYFSVLGDPTSWNDPNGVGNGYVQMSDWNATPENLVAIAPYQGRLVFFSRDVILIWIVDADPTKWQLSQTLENIGTVAPLSVKNIGDLDVMFLSDTGVRSIRARDITLNAFVNDLGSPIDLLLQAAMESATEAEIAAACAAVEPSSNRYWLYLAGTIYVFSYFPSSKVQAWSTYSPTYENLVTAPATTYSAGKTVTYTGLTPGATYTFTPDGFNVSPAQGIFTLGAGVTTFVVTGTTANATYTGVLNQVVTFAPSKFVTFGGQVYGRAGDFVMLYGGVNNNTYDYSVATATFPWLDLDSPTVRKTAKSIDYALKGNWQLSGSMDYAGVIGGGALKNINLDSQPSFQNGEVPWTDEGYHVQLSASTTLNTAATLSSLIFNFEPDDEK